MVIVSWSIWTFKKKRPEFVALLSIGWWDSSIPGGWYRAFFWTWGTSDAALKQRIVGLAQLGTTNYLCHQALIQIRNSPLFEGKYQFVFLFWSFHFSHILLFCSFLFYLLPGHSDPRVEIIGFFWYEMDIYIKQKWCQDSKYWVTGNLFIWIIYWKTRYYNDITMIL